MSSAPEFIVLGLGGHARMVVAIVRRAHGSTAGIIAYEEQPPSAAVLLNGVGNSPKVGDSGLAQRAAVYELHKSRMRNVMDPSAILLGSCDGDLFPGAIVNAGAHVHVNAIINTGAIIEHDCVIGRHSHVGPGAVLCGSVQIGEMTHIGARSVIKQGVRIGNGCVVAMGAVVRADLPDGATLLRDGRLA